MLEPLHQRRIINERLTADPAALVEQCEESYEKAVRSVVREIGLSEGRRVLLLAGPSASGKTTTAHMLVDAFGRLGELAGLVSLDDFYLGRSRTPVDLNGKQDFESVEALDLETLQACFSQLLEKGSAMFPVFDFLSGEPKPTRREVRLRKGGILIVEGIHALHPKIESFLPEESRIKLFVSVNTRVMEGDRVVFTRRQLRLMRRISRDLIYRNSPIQMTLSMWPDVIAGELRYLFPQRDRADYCLDTFHSYEPALFRNLLLPQIDLVKPDDPHYELAQGLREGLLAFRSLPEALVPQTSLLREFIPGGIYE